jgi:hypothetical protein
MGHGPGPRAWMGTALMGHGLGWARPWTAHPWAVEDLEEGTCSMAPECRALVLLMQGLRVLRGGPRETDAVGTRAPVPRLRQCSQTDAALFLVGRFSAAGAPGGRGASDQVRPSRCGPCPMHAS